MTERKNDQIYYTFYSYDTATERDKKLSTYRRKFTNKFPLSITFGQYKDIENKIIYFISIEK